MVFSAKDLAAYMHISTTSNGYTTSWRLKKNRRSEHVATRLERETGHCRQVQPRALQMPSHGGSFACFSETHIMYISTSDFAFSGQSSSCWFVGRVVTAHLKLLVGR